MKHLKKIILIITILISVFFLLDRYSKSKTIKVGVITDLSGVNSSLGIQARNGVLLAIDELNDLGGIKGRTLELLTKDHKGSTELCLQGTKELVSEGVNVIISPILSGMASWVIEGAKGSNVLIFGPTVSSDDFTGMDDNFLRVTSPSSLQGKAIAEISLKNEDKSVILIVDAKNSSYTGGVVKGFYKGLKGSNLNNIKVFEFIKESELENITQQLLELEPDAIFFIANGLDSSEIIQTYAKSKKLPRLYGSSWVRASEIHKYGGRRVDGMIFVDSFVNDNLSKKEIEFKNKINKKFNEETTSVTLYFYESMMLYAYGAKLSNSLDNEKIKKAIINIDKIEGITEDYTIDEYGDGVRSIRLYILKDNKYDFYDE